MDSIREASKRAAQALLAILALLGCGAEVPVPVADCPPRVVFVLIDALRRDHLGAFGYPRATSPTIDRLSREGLFLSNMLASSSHTVPSVLSILTSLLPSDHGVQYWSSARAFSQTNTLATPQVGPELDTLAQRFAAAGYHTAGVVSNPWLKAEFGFDAGFDEFVEIRWRDGLSINETAQRIMGEHPDEPLFLYLHYLDVHNPYLGRSREPPPFERPSEGQGRYHNGLVTDDVSEADLRFTEALYDERIVYMDGHIAALLEFVEGAGMACDTTWVVTSDHGDEFMEHGGLGHGTTLYGELIDSFAILWNPARFPPRRVEQMVRSIDLMPTLLEGQGLAPAPRAAGRSLLAAETAAEPGSPEPVLVAELADRRALVTPEWKLIRNLDRGSVELYRVRAGRALEGENLADTHRDVVLRLSAQLEGEAAGSAPARPSAATLDAETQQRLRELGYLE